MSSSIKGIYVLLVQVDLATNIQASKRRFHLDSGSYAYVGSALSGLEHRLARHLRLDKKFHWHIDYLLNVAGIYKIICAETAERKECTLAQILSRQLPAINGFGCSDCRCPSHLFYCSNFNDLKDLTFEAFMSLELRPLKLVE